MTQPSSDSSETVTSLHTDRWLDDWPSGAIRTITVISTLKILEMTVDFRRNLPAMPPITKYDSTVSAVESFRLLGSTISQDLKWEI